jgi:predicted glycosyl hydrolase (DUF1957 family)
MPKFHEQKGRTAQFVLIASDGELYGHHQPFRDKFLSYLLDGALNQTPLVATFPSLWIRNRPVEQTVNIRQKSSWSCRHGVTRWMGSCECTPHPEWKEPLRKAIDWLATEIDRLYLDIAGQYVEDPWELRNQYIPRDPRDADLERPVLIHRRKTS